MRGIDWLWRLRCESLLLALSLLSVLAVAGESKPPLLEEGELFEDYQTLIANVSEHSPVYDVAFSPDGALLASGSEDGTVRLWSVAQGKEVARLQGHERRVSSVAFSPDGAWLASGSLDRTVRLWSVAEGKEVARLEGHGGWVESVAFSLDGALLASGLEDGTVRLWSVAESKEVGRLKGHGDRVLSVAFSPDGALLASGSADRTVRLWSVAEGKEVARLDGHGTAVSSVAFSPDGTRLAAGSWDRTVRLWSVAESEEVARLDGHRDGVLSLAFSPDEALLASGSDDGTVRLWSVVEGKEVERLDGYGDAVRSVAFSPDGVLLASGSDDGAVRLWSVAAGKEVARLEGHGNRVWSVAFSPDGARLAAGSEDRTVRLWSVAQGKEVARLEGQWDAVESVAFSPDGARLALGSIGGSVRRPPPWFGAVRLWSVAQGKEVARLQGHEGEVRSVAFSPDGVLLASGSNDGTVRLWSAAQGKEVARLQGHGDRVHSVAFSPDGALLASGSEDRIVRLWSVAERKEVARLQGHGDQVQAVAFSPDGARLAAGSKDGTVRLWSVAQGKEVARLQGHGTGIWSVAFSPDGALLASGSEDGTVRLWSVAQGKEVARLQGHGTGICSVAFSPDGARLASGSGDGTVRLWNPRKGKQLWVLVSGQRDTWASCRTDGRCQRYDDGTLLVRKDAQSRLIPVSPQNSATEANLKVFANPDKLTVGDGEAREFTLRIQNVGEKTAYWINPYQSILRDKKNTNPLLFYPPPIQGVLEPGETVDLPIKVTARAAYQHPRGQQTVLDLAVQTAHGEPLKLPPIPVQTTAPTLEFDQARLERADSDTLQISLKNSGGQDLGEASYQVTLSNADKPLDTVRREQLSASALAQVPFALQGVSVIKQGIDLIEEHALEKLYRHLKNYLTKADTAKDTTLTLTVNKLGYPPHQWIFPNQPIIEPPPAWTLYGAVLAICLATLAMVYYWRLYRHPLVLKLSKTPAALPELGLDLVPAARRLLTRTHRLDTVLSGIGISAKRLEDAIAFYQNPDPQQRCALLANRLNADYQPTPHPNLAVFTLHLPDAFILNLQRCPLVFLQPAQPTEEVLGALPTLPTPVSPVTVLVSTDPEQQRALRAAPKDRARLWVVPDSSELTRLLLSPQPLEVFAQLIASQVKVTRISPYQTSGGINKDAIFFGRIQLLADILGGEPANHLIVGGRQLGKSSLLKAIDRHYRNDRRVECHYVSVGLSELRAVLAPVLDLPPDMTMILDTLRQPAPGRYRLLLIDESDVFLRKEAEQGYPTLHEFRNLSEQRCCHFIFAGFWNLYYTLSQDYQSPLKNFGTTHILGALEPDACRDLITKPMAALNIHYASESLVERIITETGGRANLIAITCNAILKNLDPGSRSIQAEEVERALSDRDLRDALGGWGNLSDDEAANRLDQVIVYATVGRDSFTLAELMQLLDSKGFDYDPERLKASLVRLELAFILGLSRNRYHYQVPLFQDMIQALEPERSLAGLLELTSRLG